VKLLIFNQKGGVGKTTTALNLGSGLARENGAPVLLVDLDPQTHLTAFLGFQAEEQMWNVSDWLAGEGYQPITINEKLSLVPGDYMPPPIREVKPARRENTTLVIDAPPSWNNEVEAMMHACDLVISPLEPEFLSMQGISRLLQRMQHHGIPWDKLRLLLCRYDDRLLIHREVRARLEERFGLSVMRCVIRNNIRLAEAPGQGLSIFDYAPYSLGAKDYQALTEKVMIEAARNQPTPQEPA
jgi:chromosome partitioning protein